MACSPSTLQSALFYTSWQSETPLVFTILCLIHQFISLRIINLVFIYVLNPLSFLIEFIGVTLANKLYKFKAYDSVTHHLYIVLCVHHPKSCLSLNCLFLKSTFDRFFKSVLLPIMYFEALGFVDKLRFPRYWNILRPSKRKIFLAKLSAHGNHTIYLSFV